MNDRNEKHIMSKKRERTGRRLFRGLAVLFGAAVVIVGAWVLANSIDSDLRPWDPGLEPEAEGPMTGVRHEGWWALMGLQPGHLDATLSQGQKSWAAWNTARQRVLALDEVTLVPVVPAAVRLDTASPLFCRPLHRCADSFRQGAAKLPDALKIAAPVASACVDIGRRTGFDEPVVRVPAALSRPTPGMALSTCGRLWLARMVLASQQGDAASAFEAWNALHQVSSGLFTGSQSTITGVVAATWLQLAHAEAPALVAAFPTLQPRVQTALAMPVPWREVSRRWWTDEGWVQDRLLYEALDVGVTVGCVAQGQGLERCQRTNPGALPPKSKPVLPNLTRSEFREQYAAVVAAAQDDDPVMALQRLKAQVRHQSDDVLSRLHFRNTLGGILLSVSSLEASVDRYMRQSMDVEATRQGAVLSLAVLSQRRQGVALSESDVIRTADGSVFLKGNIHCEGDCSHLVLRSWRVDAEAPQWRLLAGP